MIQSSFIWATLNVNIRKVFILKIPLIHSRAKYYEHSTIYFVKKLD